MSSPSPQQEVGGLSITDVDHMVVTHVGGWDYHVLNTAHDYPRVYQVDVKALTCTCEDHMYRRDGNPEVCKHVAKALLVAPSEISMDRHAAATVLEVLQEDAQYREPAATDEEVAEAVDAMETDEDGDSGSAGTDEGNGTEPDRDGQHRVRNWLQGSGVDDAHVTVYPGDHNNRPGIVMEPDNQAMTDSQYAAFKGIVNSLGSSEVHVGFGDDPCHVCGGSDGDFWYFLPGSAIGEVPE